MGILKFLVFSIKDVECAKNKGSGSQLSDDEANIENMSECSKLVFLETKMKRIWELKLTSDYIQAKMQEMNIVEAPNSRFVHLAEEGLKANNF
jgi:hypothetical protein